eukprot:GEMP01041632.1.p1 GENE.GEMP01041632.1~~GEMP01041632.1.p1  ORF type:complete len:137 (+),score=14.47 GEMP01041632.1:102-512(+)
MALIFLSFICGAYAHGHMLEPSPRGRSKNRNPVRLPATCGGRYDRGNTDSFPIVKKLSPGQSFDVQLLLTATMSRCPIRDPQLQLFQHRQGVYIGSEYIFSPSSSLLSLPSVGRREGERQASRNGAASTTYTSPAS